jgi:uncharacterized protein YndB with AHSA1/START domain
MKFEIDFEQIYPHPVEKVWNAITNRDALGAWLMETDIEPELGCHFHMWCEDGKGGTDRYVCEMLEFAPPTRMVWSWLLEGREGDAPTQVEFQLEDVSGGTRLRVRHCGDRDTETIDRFKGGWPVKLEQLGAALQSSIKR